MVRFTTEATFCRACSIKSAIRLYNLLFSNESSLLSSSLLMFKASRFFSFYIICLIFILYLKSHFAISNQPILLFTVYNNTLQLFCFSYYLNLSLDVDTGLYIHSFHMYNPNSKEVQVYNKSQLRL